MTKPDGRGTSNVGIFGGKDGKAAGDATNVVTDYAFLKGEARSPEAAFATRISLAYKDAFAKAQAEVKDVGGATAEVKFEHVPAYPPFSLAKDSKIVQHAAKAIRIARPRADVSVLERWPRRQLARQAWYSDCHHRRRAIRNPYCE